MNPTDAMLSAEDEADGFLSPAFATSSACLQNSHVVTVVDERELDDEYVADLADFDPGLSEPGTPDRASNAASVFSESEAHIAVNVVSATTVEVPSPLSPPTVNFPTPTVADKKLDDYYVAARYCRDRAATDSIIAAAENGNHLAEAYLSNVYNRDDTLVGRDRAKAVAYAVQAMPWLKENADAENMFAQFNLAMCYLDGRGVTKNEQEAVRLDRLAAEHGRAAAQCNLGWCYANGTGVAKDETQAVRYFRMAADKGHIHARCNLGWCYQHGSGVAKDNTLAVRYYQLAADQRHVDAQINLGVCYQHGAGVAKDETEAARYFKLAADQGYAPALYNLGVCYANGIGVKKDETEAVRHYRMAADKGQIHAQFWLGVCYGAGRGTSKSKAEAIKYFKLAAAQNHTDAQRKLDLLERKSEGEINQNNGHKEVANPGQGASSSSVATESKE